MPESTHPDMKVVKLSERFREILMQFRNKSMVASMLLQERIDSRVLAEDYVDYLDVGDDVTKISYLTQDRIVVYKKNLSAMHMSDYEFHLMFSETLWSSSRKFCCKPGAFVGKIFKDVPAKEVELFSNLYKSFSNKKPFTMEVVRDFRKYYNGLTYAAQQGSLGASCMKYEKCGRYMDFYTLNDHVCSLLIMKDPQGLLLGRALLWEFDGNKVMDRIYTVYDEEYSHFFKEWADENGFLYKQKQNWSNTLQFSGSDSELKFEIKLKEVEFSQYPYLDTFKWLDVRNRTLYNYKPNHFVDDTYRYRLISIADGYFENTGYLIFDDINRNWCYRAEMVRPLRMVDGVETEVWTNTSNCFWSDTLEMYLLKSESYHDKGLADYVYTDWRRNDPTKVESRILFLNRSYDNIYSFSKSKKAKSPFDSVFDGIFTDYSFRYDSPTPVTIEDPICSDVATPQPPAHTFPRIA